MGAAASGKTELILEPVEFLRRLAALVPPPRVNLPPVPRACAQLLKRTFATDGLTCDKCGGPRRVVACVFSSTVARKILEYLRLPSRPRPRAPARDPPLHELYS